MLDPDLTRTPTRAEGSESNAHDLAKNVVRFTRGASRRFNKSRSSVRDLFIDIYSNTLAGACVIMLAVSLVLALRDEITARNLDSGSLVDASWQVLPAEVFWILLTYLALVGITMTALKVGPVTVSRAQGAWWLPLPVNRRPMVLPSFLKRLITTGAGGSVVYAAYSFLTADRSVIEHAGSAATFGAATVIAVSSAAILQLKSDHSRLLRFSMLIGFLPVAVLPFLTATIWPLLAALTAAIILSIYVLPRLGAIPGMDLVRGGAVSGHAEASIFFLDVNELRRSLTVESPSSSARAGRFYKRPTRRPAAAIMRADIVAFLRLQPAPVGALIWMGICLAVALITPSLPVLVQLGVILIGACATAAGTGTVARRIAVLPELDVLLPAAPALVRSSRMLMPCLVLIVWMSVLTTSLAALSTTGPLLVLLGSIAGVGMGAGAVRAAGRPPTDWTLPPVETPFGPIPADQGSSLLRGTDMTILVIIPVLLALYLGTVHPWLIAVQCIATIIAVTVHISTSPNAR